MDVEYIGDGITIVPSFAFDSDPDLVFDDNGYPRLDRSVDAWTLRDTFAKFFTDGVFPSPGDALQIGKGDGLKVTVQPGSFIIKGAMGGVKDDPITLDLDTAAPQGNVCYAIMLRYDNTNEVRALGFRVVKGDAASTPQPPVPDQSTAEVYEYRLGYVTVPNGATDLTSATVTNEKGLAVCPYAAPFEEIDTADILGDLREQAEKRYDDYSAYLKQYYDLIASSLDETTAGNLQSQIDALEAQFSAEALADNVTIGADENDKLFVKDRSITGTKIAFYTIGENNLDNYLLQALGLLDPSTWEFDDYYDFAQELDDSEQEGFIRNTIPQDEINSWTATQIVQFDGVLGDSASAALVEKLDLSVISWSDLTTIAAGVKAKSSFVGMTKDAECGTFGSRSFRIVGLNHDDLTSGGKATLTFMPTTVFGNHKFDSGTNLDYDNSFVESELAEYLNSDVFEQFPSDLQSAIKEVVKPCSYGVWGHTYASNLGQDGLSYMNGNFKIWIPSWTELFTTRPTLYYSAARIYYGCPTKDGTIYDYCSSHNLVSWKGAGGVTQLMWTRSINSDYNWSVGDSSDRLDRSISDYYNSTAKNYFAPCFCI